MRIHFFERGVQKAPRKVSSFILILCAVNNRHIKYVPALPPAPALPQLEPEQQELEALVESLDKTCTRYKMEISAEKTKLITNSTNDIQREIKVKGQKLGTVTSFKYLGAVVSDDGSKPEVLSRIAQATAALTKLKSRKENPQKLTQLSLRSHPRHLVGKRTAQKDTNIYITSDSQVSSNFPNR